MLRFRLTSAVTLAILLMGVGQALVQGEAAAQSSATAVAAPVNLNTAGAEQLESLPGIGAKTAARIVEYRQKNGGFKKIEDLMNVRGIGEKNFLKLKALITVTPPKTEKAGSSLS